MASRYARKLTACLPVMQQFAPACRERSHIYTNYLRHLCGINHRVLVCNLLWQAGCPADYLITELVLYSTLYTVGDFFIHRGAGT